MTRPIEERLKEYSDATRGLVPQLERILKLVPEEPMLVGSHTPLKDSIRLYGIIADDLDKILRGEELKPWGITGEIPDHPANGGPR